MRQASVLVADDLFYSLNGKISIQGIYTGDISIPNDPTPAAQLVFLFIVETAPDDPFQSLLLRVNLPGGMSHELAVPVQMYPMDLSEPRVWSFRYPLLFPNPILRAGKIEAKVIHEKGEIVVASSWIVVRRG